MSNNYNFLRFLWPFRAIGGDLQSLIDMDIVLLELDVRIIVEQLLGALEFLHTLQIIHLDIKVRLIFSHLSLKGCQARV